MANFTKRTPQAIAEQAELMLKHITSGDVEYADTDISIPTFDLDGVEDFWDNFLGEDSILTGAVPEINAGSLTNGLDQGLVDILLAKLREELIKEYNEGRITGAEYTRAFQAMLTEVMSQAVQFTLQKDASRWQAQEIQLKAIQALYQAMLVKAQVAKTQYDTEAAKVEFLRAKIGAELDALQVETARFGLEHLSVEQEKMLKAQIVTEEKKQDLLANQATNTTEQTNLYKQQIKSFKARDHIQGLGLMQSTWAAYASISPEVAEIPTWANPAGINSPTGFTAEMTNYLTKAKSGNF